MFSSRKYTPLPTSSEGHRRKRPGGFAVWKRYIAIGAVAMLVIIIGYSSLGGNKDVSVNEGGSYTPDSAYEHVTSELGDDEDYSAPPSTAIDHNDEDEHDLGAGTDKTPSHTQPPVSPTAEEEEVEEEAELPAADGKQHPTSFETDPDAMSTTYCSKAHGTKALVQYALTIDAGSTGSRIHVYKFHNCGPSPQLEYETFMMLNPGLSSFKDDPTAAAASLDPLMKEALRVVPQSLWNCSPVEVKATAGLRLLGDKQSNAILEEVRNHLESKYKFPVPKGAIEIMEGKDEGVYAWITANYLLGKIGEGVQTADTLAVMDLGGASTQIVFEPDFTKSSDDFHEGDHKYELRFMGKTHTLYQHSYLNYGLMRARRSVHNLVAFMWQFSQANEWDALTEEIEVPNACLSRGTKRRVSLDPPGRPTVNVTMHGVNGGYESCKRTIELMMGKDALCKVEPCSFNGVYQPALIDHFPQGNFLALSYFTDRIKPLLAAKTDKLTLKDLKGIALDVCDGPTSWKKRWGDNKEAMDELEDRPEYCLDLTFMVGLLGLGYEIHDERTLLVEKQLRGVELGWALGAGLALVEKADLKCVV
ncbi:hypothetical protein CcaverHIS002_0208860 [Cutaneotrichosporon cavernicola]|nr:hypothetical protein CcaverHIS002_0208860 [Cutaneotrichosporon cavernicola]BEI97298.1 hypothetical protein CcaverHIS631_0208870 [Cutaneotrichosporon cavernicola]BEJ05072.1 hypothetical protein CcaverHIS641_0208890 [Cutaneotrichosporon cavernicola]